MKIAVIDADLIGRTKHRFPNLACEKISSYWKNHGADVRLETGYNNINLYDEVYVSKVFTDTPVPEWLTEKENIHFGGTGFYFDKASDLPSEIEHSMPDYHLYDDWINSQVEKALLLSEFRGGRNKLKEKSVSSSMNIQIILLGL